MSMRTRLNRTISSGPRKFAATSLAGVIGAGLVLFSLTATAAKSGPSSLTPRSPFAPYDARGAVRSSFDCQDVRRAALELSVHAYNLANRATTRTPEGGPFRPRVVDCRAETCRVLIRDNATMSVYEPGHPDANAQGYVVYPDLSIGSEFAAVTSAAAQLKLLSSQDVCGTSSIASATSALIKYGPSQEMISDTLAFTADGKLSSWNRVGKDGRAYGLQFNPDGTVSNR